MSRFYFDALVLSLLLPALVGAGCLFLAAGMARWRKDALAIVPVALAPATAIFLSQYLLGWRKYPPALSHEWVAFVGLGAAMVHAAAAALNVTAWWNAFVSLEVGVFAVWFFLPAWEQPQYVKERSFWLLFFPQVAMLTWSLFLHMGATSGGVGPVLPMAIWAAAIVPLLVLGANARFAQMALIVAGCLGGAAIASLLAGPRRWWYHVCPSASVLLLGLTLQGYLYSRTYGMWEEVSPHDIPRVCFLLVMLAPLAGAAMEVPLARRLRPWQRRGLQGVLVALVAGAALYLALTLPESVVEEGWE